MSPRNPLRQNPMDRRKQRIDDLAATAGRPGGRGTVDETPGVSLIASAWRRLRRDPVVLLGATITVVFIVIAVISPWIAPHDPADGLLIEQVRRQSNPVPGPQPGFPLGADDRGRDLLSRLLVGSQQTLIVGVAATLLGLFGGLVLGILASTRSSCARSTCSFPSPRSSSPSRSRRSPASPASGR